MVSAEPMAPLERLLSRIGTTHGQLAWGALTATALSGVALGALYDPADPLASVELIQGGVPMGWLIRAVHRIAAHAFLLTLLLHCADHVVARSYRRLGSTGWWRLVGPLVLAFGGMFGGFLLRADAEAVAARSIAQSATRALPWLGTSLSAFLWGVADGPLHAPYTHHLVTFTLLPWLIAVKHARGVWAGWLLSVASLAAITALALFLHPGPGLAPDCPQHHLFGPWYFIGLQEALRWMPTLVAGVVLPAIGFGLLGALGHVGDPPRQRRLESAVRWTLLLGLSAYVLVSALSLLVRGRA